MQELADDAILTLIKKERDFDALLAEQARSNVRDITLRKVLFYVRLVFFLLKKEGLI